MRTTLILQLTRLGDCLQTTRLLSAWRQTHPGERLVMLTRPELAVLFQRNREVDEVLTLVPPAGAFPENAPWLAELRQRQFSHVINLTHDTFSSQLARALAPERIWGLSVQEQGKLRAYDPWSLYLLSLLRFRRQNLFNLVDIYTHLAGTGPQAGRLQFDVDAEARQEASRRLAGLAAGAPLVGFQVGAHTVRRWPASHFIALGRRLVEELGCRLLLFGSEAERPMAAEVAAGLPPALNLAGTTSLPQLAALLERCALLVTCDTGAMHLAAAVGTRVLALFQSTAYFRETGPYGAGHWVIQSRTVQQYGERSDSNPSEQSVIPSEEVWYAARTLLGTSGLDPAAGKAAVGVQAGPEMGANPFVEHFRSTFNEGHLDFYPVAKRPLEGFLLLARLQRAVWLAVLDGKRLEADQAAVSVLSGLQQYYQFPAETALRRFLVQSADGVLKLLRLVREYRELIEGLRKRLTKNPAYVIPPPACQQLTEFENKILAFREVEPTAPFAHYFETGLCMAEGKTSLEYLTQYQQPVTLLEKQLLEFNGLLQAVGIRLTKNQAATDCHAGNAVTSKG